MEDLPLLVTHGQDLAAAVGTIDPGVGQVTGLDLPLVHVLGLVVAVVEEEAAHDEKDRAREPPGKDEEEADGRGVAGGIVVKAHGDAVSAHPKVYETLYFPEASGFRRLVSLRVAKLSPWKRNTFATPIKRTHYNIKKRQKLQDIRVFKQFPTPASS